MESRICFTCYFYIINFSVFVICCIFRPALVCRAIVYSNQLLVSMPTSSWCSSYTHTSYHNVTPFFWKSSIAWEFLHIIECFLMQQTTTLWQNKLIGIFPIISFRILINWILHGLIIEYVFVLVLSQCKIICALYQCYQYTKIFQCSTSTFIYYTKSLSNILCR